MEVVTGNMVLKVAGEEIMKADVTEYVLNVQWCSGDWERWEEFKNDQEFVDLTTNAQEKLDRAKDYADSSSGKGKKGKGNNK